MAFLQKIKMALGLIPKGQVYTLKQDPTNGEYNIEEYSYDAIATESDQAIPDYEPPDYESWTKAELLDYAKKLELKVNSKSKKKDIIKALTTYCKT